jgi:acyl carrier protein
MESIHIKLENIFKKLFNIPTLSPSDRLQEDLMLDSMRLIELQVEIEDSFEMRFDPMQDDLASIFKTVGSLAAFLKENHE